MVDFHPSLYSQKGSLKIGVRDLVVPKETVPTVSEIFYLKSYFFLDFGDIFIIFHQLEFYRLERL